MAKILSNVGPPVMRGLCIISSHGNKLENLRLRLTPRRGCHPRRHGATSATEGRGTLLATTHSQATPIPMSPSQVIFTHGWRHSSSSSGKDDGGKNAPITFEQFLAELRKGKLSFSLSQNNDGDGNERFTEEEWMKIMGIERYKRRPSAIHDYTRPEKFTGQSLIRDEFSVASQEQLLTELRLYEPGDTGRGLWSEVHEDHHLRNYDSNSPYDSSTIHHRGSCPCELCQKAPMNFEPPSKDSSSKSQNVDNNNTIGNEEEGFKSFEHEDLHLQSYELRNTKFDTTLYNGKSSSSELCQDVPLTFEQFLVKLSQNKLIGTKGVDGFSQSQNNDKNTDGDGSEKFTEEEWMKIMGIEKYKRRPSLIHDYKRPEKFTGQSLIRDEFSVASQEQLLTELRLYEPGDTGRGLWSEVHEDHHLRKYDSNSPYDSSTIYHRGSCPCELCQSAPENFKPPSMNSASKSQNNMSNTKGNENKAMGLWSFPHEDHRLMNYESKISSPSAMVEPQMYWDLWLERDNPGEKDAPISKCKKHDDENWNHKNEVLPLRTKETLTSTKIEEPHKMMASQKQLGLTPIARGHATSTGAWGPSAGGSTIQAQPNCINVAQQTFDPNPPNHIQCIVHEADGETPLRDDIMNDATMTIMKAMKAIQTNLDKGDEVGNKLPPTLDDINNAFVLKLRDECKQQNNKTQQQNSNTCEQVTQQQNNSSNISSTTGNNQDMRPPEVHLDSAVNKTLSHGSSSPCSAPLVVAAPEKEHFTVDDLNEAQMYWNLWLEKKNHDEKDASVSRCQSAPENFKPSSTNSASKSQNSNNNNTNGKITRNTNSSANELDELNEIAFSKGKQLSGFDRSNNHSHDTTYVGSSPKSMPSKPGYEKWNHVDEALDKVRTKEMLVRTKIEEQRKIMEAQKLLGSTPIAKGPATSMGAWVPSAGGATTLATDGGEAEQLNFDLDPANRIPCVIHEVIREADGEASPPDDTNAARNDATMTNVKPMKTIQTNPDVGDRNSITYVGEGGDVGDAGDVGDQSPLTQNDVSRDFELKMGDEHECHMPYECHTNATRMPYAYLYADDLYADGDECKHQDDEKHQQISDTQQQMSSTHEQNNTTRQQNNSTHEQNNSTQQQKNSTQQDNNSTHEQKNSTRQDNNSTHEQNNSSSISNTAANNQDRRPPAMHLDGVVNKILAPGPSGSRSAPVSVVVTPPEKAPSAVVEGQMFWDLWLEKNNPGEKDANISRRAETCHKCGAPAPMAVGGGGGAEASSGGATTGSGGAMRVVAGMGLVALGLLGFTVLTVPHEDIEEPRPMKEQKPKPEVEIQISDPNGLSSSRSSSFRQKSTSNSTTVNGHTSSHSTTTTTVKQDGTTETKKVEKDSRGNVVETLTRKRGGRRGTVITKRDSEGNEVIQREGDESLF